MQSPLHTIDEANAVSLQAGDQLLFKRGTVCKGMLRPQGSGTAEAPILVGAYGEGKLPQIVADAQDEAAFKLLDQQYWDVSSLDFAGGTTYGVYARANTSVVHHLRLRDLRVHDVRGMLKHKESGLVVVDAGGPGASFEDVTIDGVQAWNTTQWAGIFVRKTTHVQISNSFVHDVQGDGIVVFEGHDAIIRRSVAWHTGMQHVESIGTPNAIWTWRCTDCVVEDNEAFLTDSPGVDGGAFDIDYGNTRNTVQRNFGHDTAGYCVSVFAASGPTIDSVVSDNLCIHSGMSPHLAQRQGAILLMTWSDGALKGVKIQGNRIYWQPPGDTPAIQTGDQLQATDVQLLGNEIWSTGASFIDPALKYAGHANRYFVQGGTAADLGVARSRFRLLPENESTLAEPSKESALSFAPSSASGRWRLNVTIPECELTDAANDRLRAMLVTLKSAARQYIRSGLKITLTGNSKTQRMAEDWSLHEDGVEIEAFQPEKTRSFSVKLISPSGKAVRAWQDYPSPVDLGFELRQRLGSPNFSYLGFESVRATD